MTGGQTSEKANIDLGDFLISHPEQVLTLFLMTSSRSELRSQNISAKI